MKRFAGLMAVVMLLLFAISGLAESTDTTGTSALDAFTALTGQQVQLGNPAKSNAEYLADIMAGTYATAPAVEDDPKIGLLIEMTVKKAAHNAQRMVDAVELEHMLKKEPVPDLLLLDLMLREKNGFTVMKEWKERTLTRSIPVIIISARSAEHDKVMGLELGAEDYITKPFGVRELQARIQTVLRRLPAEPEKLTVGQLTLLPDSRDVYIDNKRIDLTQKEFELLLHLARHAGTTVTRATLIRDIWGYATEEDTSRTVDSHIKTLRLKLGDTAGEPRFIQTIRGTGYRLICGEGA